MFGCKLNYAKELGEFGFLICERNLDSVFILLLVRTWIPFKTGRYLDIQI